HDVTVRTTLDLSMSLSDSYVKVPPATEVAVLVLVRVTSSRYRDHMPRRGAAGDVAGYDPRSFPAVAVTVDVVVLTICEGTLQVVLVERGGPPFEGQWALPGGFIHPDETLDEAAARELHEETAVDAAAFLQQFGAYGSPNRDPRMRVVTVA